MEYLLLAALFLGGLLVAFSTARIRRTPAGGDRPEPEEMLRNFRAGLRALERRADHLPLLGSSLQAGRKKELHRAARDRLPSLWGDTAIYLREGRRDLRGAILAAIDNLDDPLSRLLAERLRPTGAGAPLETALRAVAQELDYRPFTVGVESILLTQAHGGDLARVLGVLRDQAMDRMAYERERAAATLENRLIVTLWPLLFLALMAAIFTPIAVSGLGTLLGF